MSKGNFELGVLVDEEGFILVYEDSLTGNDVRIRVDRNDEFNWMGYVPVEDTDELRPVVHGTSLFRELVFIWEHIKNARTRS
jgi:hypothetical protein